jgi:hypothetical protein
MKLSLSSLGPSTFAHEIAVPPARFAATFVDLDDDDVPTRVLVRPARRTSKERARPSASV